MIMFLWSLVKLTPKRPDLSTQYSLYPNSSLQCFAALSNGLVTGENTALSPNSSAPATNTDSNSHNASVVLSGTGNIEGHSVATHHHNEHHTQRTWEKV